MTDPRWRVGRTLGRTLYRLERCIGMVDTQELASEIVAAMNLAAPDDREAISMQLSREANRIFNRQARDYPSNVLDVVAHNIRRGATENLTVRDPGFPVPKHVEEQDAGLLLRAAVSFHFPGASGLLGDYVMGDYDDEANDWVVTAHKPGGRDIVEPTARHESQAAALQPGALAHRSGGVHRARECSDELVRLTVSMDKSKVKLLDEVWTLGAGERQNSYDEIDGRAGGLYANGERVASFGSFDYGVGSDPGIDLVVLERDDQRARLAALAPRMAQFILSPTASTRDQLLLEISRIAWPNGAEIVASPTKTK